jgi:HEAT repeat protein
MRTWPVVAVVMAAGVAACGDSSKPAAGRAPYTATIDVSALVRQLGSEETFDADEAAERLAGLGDAVVPALEGALATEGKPVRLGIVDALGPMESARAGEVLARIARSDPEPEVRGMAVLKLGEGAAPAARPALEAALADASALVSQTAAVACGALCTTPAAIDRMIDVALESLPDTDLPRMRASLGRLLAGPDREAARYAHDRLVARTAAILASAAPLDARGRAAIFAMQVDVPGMEPTLVEVVRSARSTMLRTAALETVARTGSAAAVAPLEEALRDPTVAVAAAGALRSIAARGVPEATAALAKLEPPAAPPRTP